MAHTILRLPVVKQRTGLSRSTIYQRIADGNYGDRITVTRYHLHPFLFGLW
jgi:predicted DNA-binding transcriptional regulator AlpA